MSLMKYIEGKKRPAIVIVTDNYREQLDADMSSLLLKPDAKLNEVRKKTINVQEITKVLSQLHYPLAEEMSMAIRTGDSKRVNHAHLTFKKWAEYSNPDSFLRDQVETVLFQYQAKLHNKEFGPNETNDVVNSIVADSQVILEQMAQKIDLAISRIHNWQNHKVVVEGLYPESGWVVNEARIIIGDKFPVSFICECGSLAVKKLEEGEAPSSIRNDVKNLLEKLRQNPKYEKILTLFMSRPLSERRFFEIAKRDVSLGIAAALPNHITLMKNPPAGDSDVWKVRVEEKYLREIKDENNTQYHIVGNDCPIKWIERLNNEK